MLKRSRDHLDRTGETYFQHMRFALLVGAIAVAAGLACIIHAVVPALCQSTCSRTVDQLKQLFGDRLLLRSTELEASGVIVFVGLFFLATAMAMCVTAISGHIGLAALITLLAFAFPLTFLLTNPNLEPLDDAG